MLFVLANVLLFTSSNVNKIGNNEDVAIEILVGKIKSDSLYTNKYSLDCLTFIVNDLKENKYEIKIYEKHNSICGGDASITHVVDRFIVNIKTIKIMWFNTVEDKYISYFLYLMIKRNQNKSNNQFQGENQ